MKPKHRWVNWLAQRDRQVSVREAFELAAEEGEGKFKEVEEFPGSIVVKDSETQFWSLAWELLLHATEAAKKKRNWKNNETS